MHRHKANLSSLIVASAGRSEFFFRIGMEASGNEHFAEFIELLLKFIDKNHNDAIGELNAILTKMLLAQERRNWVGLSDIIQYEFIDFFNKSMNEQ